MKEKRYSIVRVDNRCPVEEEEDIYLIDRIKMFPCFNDIRLSCKNCRYGDTKEQLIRKIAQVIFKVKLARFRQVWKCECNEMEKKGRYIDSLVLARKIVEFLGVEE